MKLTKSKAFLMLSVIVIAFAFLTKKGVELLIYQKKLNNSRPELLYEITLSDPLFYSPAVNAASFKESINTLKKAENDFKEILLKKYATKKKGGGGSVSGR